MAHKQDEGGLKIYRTVLVPSVNIVVDTGWNLTAYSGNKLKSTSIGNNPKTIMSAEVQTKGRHLWKHIGDILLREWRVTRIKT